MAVIALALIAARRLKIRAQLNRGVSKSYLKICVTTTALVDSFYLFSNFVTGFRGQY